MSRILTRLEGGAGVPWGKYRTILADPPWHFKVRNEKTGAGRSASQHYATMSRDAIRAMNVAGLAAPDAVLLLWVTEPCLEQGLELMRAWGFDYKTIAFTWVKLKRSAPAPGTWDASSLHTRMGFWSRSNPEQCLLGTRGKAKRLHADVRELIIAPVREHSRKPDEVYTRTERLVPGPYLDLFSRTTRRGWDAFGNEAGMWTTTARGESRTRASEGNGARSNVAIRNRQKAQAIDAGL
jgi:N6-adenosine-specific RNA methylase IME4